jgi:hypothetical protein
VLEMADRANTDWNAEADKMLAEFGGTGEADPSTDPAEADTSVEMIADEDLPAEGDTQELEANENDEGDDSQAAELAKWEERYKNAQRKMTEATQNGSDWQRYAGELEQKVRELESQLANQGGSRTADTAETDTPLEEWDITEKLAYDEAKKAQAEVRDVKQRLAALDQRERAAEKARADYQHLTAIKATHPDLEAIAASPVYGEWLQNQPPAVKRIAQEGTAQDVVWMLSQFKAEKGIKASSTRLDDARKAAIPSIRGSSGPIPNKGNGKIPYSKISHLSSRDLATRYPDDTKIDWNR